MSDDLIKRSDVLGYIRRLNGCGLGKVKTLEYIRKYVERLPSADRPQGEWIDRSDGGRILHPWWESYECSQCKEQGSGAWNFCPHCGARMKGADDE